MKHLFASILSLILTTSAAVAQVAAVAPGGRITYNPGVAEMRTDYVGGNTVYYAPYGPPFVSIFNGTGFATLQFTSSLTDKIGPALQLDASWPANTIFDEYLITMDGTHVVPCAIPWSQPPGLPPTSQTRATLIDVLGGQLVNTTAATCKLSGSATYSLPQYQGSYVGKFYTTSTPGYVDFKFGNAATGGGPALVSISNAYNPVPGTFVVQDTNPGWPQLNGAWEPLDLQCSGCAAGQKNTITAITEGRAIDASVSIGIYPGAGANLYVGIALLSAVYPYNGIWSKCAAGPGGPAASSSIFHSATSLCGGYLPEGLVVLQAMELGTPGNGTFYSNQGPQLGAMIAHWMW